MVLTTWALVGTTKNIDVVNPAVCGGDGGSGGRDWGAAY